MTRQRLPLALAIAALAIAIFGSTPFGQAGIARVVPFAKNAHAVDGIHASAVPKPGTLLPLNRDAMIPSTVLPPAPAQRATQGSARYRLGEVGAIGEVGHLELPDANVIVRAKAAFRLTTTSPYANAGTIGCELAVGSEADHVTINIPMSTAVTSGSVIVPFEVAAHRSPGRIAVLRCERGGLNSLSGSVVVGQVRMSAIVVDNLMNSEES